MRAGDNSYSTKRNDFVVLGDGGTERGADEKRGWTSGSKSGPTRDRRRKEGRSEGGEGDERGRGVRGRSGTVIASIRLVAEE